jgi:hypothetical protein
VESARAALSFAAWNKYRRAVRRSSIARGPHHQVPCAHGLSLASVPSLPAKLKAKRLQAFMPYNAAIDANQLASCAPRYSEIMTRMIHDQCEPTCPICSTPMVLVRIDPRVASFSELRTFRCFACDDVRTTERPTIFRTRVSAIPPPLFPRAA